MWKRHKKRLYLPLVLLVAFGVVKVIEPFAEGRPWIWLIAAPVFFLPGRVLRYQWREFFQGKQALARGEFKAASHDFLRFLERVQKRPALKRWNWLAFQAYSSDIEAMAYNNLGVCYLKTGLYPQADDALTKAIKMDPDYALAHFNLGLAAAFDDQPKRAAHHLLKSEELGFSDDIGDRIARGFHQLDDVLNSEVSCDEAESWSSLMGAMPKLLGSPDSDVGLLKAIVFHLAGLHDRAEPHLRKAWTNGVTEAFWPLFSCLLESGRDEEARLLVDELRKQDPDDARVLEAESMLS